MNGLTLDTGALIAFERRQRRVVHLLSLAAEQDRLVTVPSPVIVEWWRGQRAPLARILDAVVIEPLALELARVAGEALAKVGHGPSVVDAVVMASAAQRGDQVLTGDVEDLERLRAVFPNVRVLAV